MNTHRTENEANFFFYTFPTSLPLLFSILLFATISTTTYSSSIAVAALSANPIIEFVDCPELGANFGDTCDDGDSATINDVVNTDCICKGTYPAPANDLCENAEELIAVHNSDDCATNLVYGTTLGATDNMGPFECDSLDGPWPDVFYTFNSGDYRSIMIDISLITQTDVVVSVNEVCGDGEVIHCSLSETFYFMATKNTDYIVRVAPASGSEGAGEFNICIRANHLCDWGVDWGDQCYILGYYGVVNDVCECELTIGNCDTQFDGGDFILNGTNEVQSIGPLEPAQYVEYINVFEGDQYTLTSDVGDGYTNGYITIRQSGTVIGQGWSPVTVTAIEDGSMFADYTVWDICEVDWFIFYDTSIQCITCDYDCPSIGADIGDACDDANPNTSSDLIDEDCNCIGESESGSLSGTADWNNSCGDRGITLTFYAPGKDTLLYSYTTTIDENGDFDLPDSIAAGNYDIYTKIDGYLANSYLNEFISVGANSLLLGTLIPGDLNNNNFINISDLSVLNMSYGKSEGDADFNNLADMNCDGSINLIDVSILNISFGQIGAQP